MGNASSGPNKEKVMFKNILADRPSLPRLAAIAIVALVAAFCAALMVGAK